MKTEVAVLYQQNTPLVLEEVKIPDLQKGQTLVKILYSGVCHSQINEMKGYRGEDKFLPHTLGHEGSGIVEKIGTGVTNVKPGDFVVLSWIKGPGLDNPSSHYFKGQTKINSGAISTFNKHSIISENRLTKITEDMPADKAALLGCAVPTGGGIVTNTLNVKNGESIAIFGIGGIGASALLAAEMKKCSKIIAIDIHENKLNIAKKLGATHTINAKKYNPASKIQELTDSVGVDHSIESSGTKEAMEMAFNSIKNSGTAVIAGNIRCDEKICIDPFDLIKGKNIIGTWGGETKPDKDIPLYVKMYLSGELKLDKLISKTYSLKEINKAFDDLKSGKVMRPLIDMSS